ncbi:MAG: hypothetical protein O3A00_10610 [Planctomycetota bacterium]|nr:hypothetical protein [Planctomycetota bacterium]
MPTPTERIDFQSLLSVHEKLQEELSAATNKGRVQELESHVDEFLNEMRKHVPFATSTDRRDLLNRMASEWQKVFTTLLGIPKNVYAVIEINNLPNSKQMLSRLPKVQQIKGDEFKHLIRERAYVVGEKSKQSWLKQLLLKLEVSPHEVDWISLTPPRRTGLDDWRDAAAYVACDVLEGYIDLAIQLSIDAFGLLESVWFEDAKRIKAFFLWEADGGPCEPVKSRMYYDNACRLLHGKLMDKTLKVCDRAFASIAKWLKRELLTSGRVDVGKSHARLLISTKAQRLWERTQREDGGLNWEQAEHYVRQFYENLIPAVTRNDKQAVQAVLGATLMCECPRSGCEIVNALEVALITYFVDAELMEEFFEQNASYL